MNHVAKFASVAVLGLAALNIPSQWLRAQSAAAPANLPPCPAAGTYTADVDGAPNGGTCRAFIDRVAAPVSYNIPPGKLFDGLKAYLEQSGARGLVPLDLMVAGTSTTGVSGNLPPREALDRLLSGTNVTYMQDQSGTFRFPPLKDSAVPGGRCNWDKAPRNPCPADD